MGSCVSTVDKGTAQPAKKTGVTATTTTTTAFGSKSNKQVLPESPVMNGDKLFLSYGSKEESFFDSQPWLESDAEDDFHSVRGDFTPSRGSTPVHHNFSIATPQHNKLIAVEVNSTINSMTVFSPMKRKKRLSELFQDDSRDNLNLLYDDQADDLPCSDDRTQTKIANDQKNVEGTERFDKAQNKEAKSPKPVQYFCLHLSW